MTCPTRLIQTAHLNRTPQLVGASFIVWISSVCVGGKFSTFWKLPHWFNWNATLFKLHILSAYCSSTGTHGLQLCFCFQHLSGWKSIPFANCHTNFELPPIQNSHLNNNIPAETRAWQKVWTWLLLRQTKNSMEPSACWQWLERRCGGSGYCARQKTWWNQMPVDKGLTQGVDLVTMPDKNGTKCLTQGVDLVTEPDKKNLLAPSACGQGPPHGLFCCC